MTASPLNELESRIPDPSSEESRSKAVASKSPTQLAMARFFKDKKSMVALSIVVLYMVAGILGPILDAAGIIDPLTPNQDLIGSDALPIGNWWGISWDHPLGVEPGIGRDVLSRIWLGITYSLVVALSASVIAVVLGVVLGVIAGFSGGWTDSIIGRI